MSRSVSPSSRFGFGVDVGGSSLKAAVVDLHSGEFHGERLEVPTPQPATPDAIAEAVAQLTRQAAWSGPVGIALPSVIVRNIARTAANIDATWVGTDVVEPFSTVLGHHDVTVLNDADAAGLAEVSFGSPEAQRGSALFLTFGSGICLSTTPRPNTLRHPPCARGKAFLTPIGPSAWKLFFANTNDSSTRMSSSLAAVFRKTVTSGFHC